MTTARLAPALEVHRAFSREYGEGLVGVMAVQVVLIPRIGIIVDPGMESGGANDGLALLLPVSQLQHINDLNSHGNSSF